MKHKSTLFLRSVIILIGIGVLAGMIRFPQTEGRAANLDLISIYTDPFIIYIYIASIPFFVGLYQAFKLLELIDRNKIFTQASVKAVRNIKYSALAIIGFLIVAILLIRVMAQGDDSAGPIMLGLIAIFISTVIATSTVIIQKLLRNTV